MAPTASPQPMDAPVLASSGVALTGSDDETGTAMTATGRGRAGGLGAGRGWAGGGVSVGTPGTGGGGTTTTGAGGGTVTGKVSLGNPGGLTATTRPVESLTCSLKVLTPRPQTAIGGVWLDSSPIAFATTATDAVPQISPVRDGESAGAALRVTSMTYRPFGTKPDAVSWSDTFSPAGRVPLPSTTCVRTTGGVTAT